MLGAIEVIDGDGLVGRLSCDCVACPEVGTFELSGFLVCCPQIGAVWVLVGGVGLLFVSGRFPQTGVLRGLAGGIGVSTLSVVLVSPDL